MELNTKPPLNDKYIVYEVRYKNEPVYIGSGKEGRDAHVRSGHSHNVELNKLFFTEPHLLVVTVLRENLSKEESLETEKGFIQALHPKFNIVFTDKHGKAIANAKRSKSRRKSYRTER